MSLEEAFGLAKYAEKGMCIFSFMDEEITRIGKINLGYYTIQLDGAVNTVKLPNDTLVQCQFMSIGAFFAAVELAREVAKSLSTRTDSLSHKWYILALQVLSDANTKEK